MKKNTIRAMVLRGSQSIFGYCKAAWKKIGLGMRHARIVCVFFSIFTARYLLLPLMSNSGSPYIVTNIH